MDSGFLVDASSGVLGGKDWALAVGGGKECAIHCSVMPGV